MFKEINIIQGLLVDKDVKPAINIKFQRFEKFCTEVKQEEEGERFMINVLNVNTASNGWSNYSSVASSLFPKIGTHIFTIGEADSDYWTLVSERSESKVL